MKVYCDEETCDYNYCGYCCTLDEIDIVGGRCVCFVEKDEADEEGAENDD